MSAGSGHRLLRERNLLLVTAVAEGATALSVLMAPAVVSTLLLGSAQSASETRFFERVTGAALLCISVACWLSRRGDQKQGQRGLLAGLLVYNVATLLTLAYAGVFAGARGLLLWPATLYHAALAAWCAACLYGPRSVRYGLSGNAGM
jgi:hypothetical protein